jgi:3-hydroxyisobutyrate dehydrogenase-like beta-hydroxyacid dehydrogenase
MEVGFIGLGRMGQAMARNLLKAGHRVFVYNRTRTRAEELRDEGAEVADSPAGACKGDIVITMLADDDAVEEIVLGSGGLIRALRENAIHLSMSTITVGFSEVLTEAHYAAGQHFVAAPVFGHPEAAAAARLFIVAAGEAEPLDRCGPLFDDLGQKTFIVDRFPPKANLVKLSGNFLVASVIECLGEAVALIRKAGVDPTQFPAILTGSLFAAPVYETYGELILEERYRPAGITMLLGLRDMRSVLAAAESKNVPMPVASLVRDRFISGIARGKADLDWSALAHLAAQDAGL